MENFNSVEISIAEALGRNKLMNNATTGEHEERKKFILKGVVKVGEAPVEYSTKTYIAEQGALVEETIVKAGICAGDGRVFRTDSDVASACLKCGYVLCQECADKFACSHCGQQACPHCGYFDINDAFCCSKC